MRHYLLAYRCLILLISIVLILYELCALHCIATGQPILVDKPGPPRFAQSTILLISPSHLTK